MDKSGIVIYLCKIDNHKYLISLCASDNIYEYYGYKFTNLIECVNFIDSVARRNLDFMIEI
jgi:hypothetical protein